MAFNFQVDEGFWTEASLAGDAYAYAMWQFLNSVNSLNHHKNYAKSFGILNVGIGSNVFTLEHRVYGGGPSTYNSELSVGTPVIIGKASADKTVKVPVRFGVVTAYTPNGVGAATVTVNVTHTNGVIPTVQDNSWVIVACPQSFDISGTISFPGGTGQTTAIASRNALKIYRPSAGFEAREDFVGYCPAVTSSSATQAYLSRYFAACRNGGQVKVGGFVDGYDYPQAGRHPGVAILSAPNGGDVAGVSMAATGNIQFGNVSNLHFDFCLYIPELEDVEFVVSLGMYCRNSLSTLRTFLPSTTIKGQGINVVIPSRFGMVIDGVQEGSVSVGMLGVTPVNYSIDPFKGWAKLWSRIDNIGGDNNLFYSRSDYDFSSSVLYSLSGANTTSSANWMTPYVKIRKLSGDGEAWVAVDFMSVSGECAVAR